MNPALKWIGGASAAALLTLVIVFSVGSALPGAAEAEPATPAAAPAVAAPAAAIPSAALSVPAPAADTPFAIRRVLPIDGPIRYGDWHWHDANVPDGPLLMTVDLEARTISVWRGGYEIGAAAVMLGTDETPTPLGVFPILSKERHNVSEKYGNAPMPYTLRLTPDGVSIHGSEVDNGYASHGCVGVPDAFAAKLFAIAARGDKVVITRGRMVNQGDSLAG